MVVDTMVFVYALLRVESQHQQALSALERAEQIIVITFVWVNTVLFTRFRINPYY